MKQRKKDRSMSILVAAIFALAELPRIIAGGGGGDGFVGVSVGRAVSGLPRAERVVDLLRSMGVAHVRIYDADSSMVAALAGSNIGVALGVPNNAVASMAASRAAAATWFARSVAPFLPNTNVTSIVVGDAPPPTVVPLILPALHNLRRAMLNASGAATIKLTTAVSSAALLGAFPPSHAFFNDTAVEPQLLRFLATSGSHLVLDLDAHAAYAAATGATPLSYTLFEPNAGASDPGTGLNYTNLFDAMLDAAFAACARIVRDRELPIVVQTGWPWRDVSESNQTAAVATASNAKAFNTGVIRHVLRRRGTPMRPTTVLSAYIYELYDEDLVSRRVSYGLFNVDQTPVYKLDVAGVTLAASSAAEAATGGDEDSEPQRRWCVAKPGLSNDVLDSALNWACGIGNADCGPVQPGGKCFLPDQVASHASFAFNSYYQRNVQGNGTCDFHGAAQLVTVDPSYGSCLYPSTSAALESVTGGNSTSDQFSGGGIVRLSVAAAVLSCTMGLVF